MQDNLCRLDGPNDIKDTFLRLISQKTIVELWKPISKHQKYRFLSRVHRLQDDEIFFTTAQKIQLDAGEIYGYIQQSQIVFKTQITFLSEFKLATKIPDYLVYKELRKNERKDFKDRDIIASYHQGANRSSHHKIFNYHSKILNYSKNGIALNIKKNQLNQFYLGDHLTLKIPMQQSNILFGQIKHITPVGYEDFSMGIQFV